MFNTEFLKPALSIDSTASHSESSHERSKTFDVKEQTQAKPLQRLDFKEAIEYLGLTYWKFIITITYKPRQVLGILVTHTKFFTKIESSKGFFEYF